MFKGMNIENTKGRPLKFKTPDELESSIKSYFDECVPEIITLPDGKIQQLKLNPPTLTGLALHLGFESRQSIYDYENRNDDFSYTIKRARLTCENFAEVALLSGTVQPAAGIFILKNYGWRDTQNMEMELNSNQNIILNHQPVSKIEKADE